MRCQHRLFWSSQCDSHCLVGPVYYYKALCHKVVSVLCVITEPSVTVSPVAYCPVHAQTLFPVSNVRFLKEVSMRGVNGVQIFCNFLKCTCCKHRFIMYILKQDLDTCWELNTICHSNLQLVVMATTNWSSWQHVEI